MDLTADMCRDASAGSGRRFPLHSTMLDVSGLEQQSLQFRGGTTCLSGWNYTDPRQVQANIGAYNQVQAAEWVRRQSQEKLLYQTSLKVHGCAGDALNIDSLLLDHPGSVNLACDLDERAPLHLAALRGHAGLSQLLLHRGASGNQKNHLGQTALHEACEANHVVIVIDILTSGCDADQRDATGQTALHRAAFAGSLDALSALLDYGVDLKVRDHGGLLALHAAASRGRVEATAMILQRNPALVNEEAGNGWTALHLAASGGHAEACGLLLASGADAGAPEAEGQTPLHLAAGSGCEATVLALLRGGGDVQAADTAGRQPLHRACEDGHLAAAQALLEAGASASMPDGRGRQPLLEAAEGGHLHLCALLLQHGASPGARDLARGVPSAVDAARRLRHLALLALFERPPEPMEGVAGSPIPGTAPANFDGAGLETPPAA